MSECSGMARECNKCGEHIPRHKIIGGKKRNLQRRKYCLECSPFGSHNTSKLEDRIRNGSQAKLCMDCKKKHDQKGRRCFKCYFHQQKAKVQDKVYGIVGDECWFCGYSKTRKNLCFHHVDPSTKSFQLTTRELMLKWDRVYNEMRKCTLVCHNCHGEIHDNLITPAEVNKVWKSRWASIAL